ncbi:MAG: hypothetical protein M1813_005313 [Trichoglossum hirsutum]|nr:MAG: hypothetical protein M1813_005313 [Trichoglossum hirsutum]
MAVLSVNLEHTPLELPIHISLFRDVENSAFLKQQLLDGNEEFEYAFIDASVILSTVHALAAAYRAVTDLLNSRIRSRNLHSEIVFALSPNNNVWVRLFSTATSSRLHVTATALKVRLFMSSSKPSVIMPDLNIILLMYEISTIECRTCSQKYLAIFWNLSLSCVDSRIAESFRRFGISDNTTSLLVIKVSTSPSITHESVARHLDLVVKGTPVEFSDNNLSEMTDISRVRKVYKLNKGQSVSPSKRMGAEGRGIDGVRLSEVKELEIAVIGAMALRGAS